MNKRLSQTEIFISKDARFSNTQNMSSHVPQLLETAVTSSISLLSTPKKMNSRKIKADLNENLIHTYCTLESSLSIFPQNKMKTF